MTMSSKLAVLTQIKNKRDMFAVSNAGFNGTYHVDMSGKFKNQPRVFEHNTTEIHDIFNDGSSVATYPFSNNVADLGGTYDGTATNISYVDGVFNRSVYLTNLSKIVLGQMISASGFTISAWVKVDPGQNFFIFNTNTYPTKHYGVCLQIYQDDMLQFQESSGVDGGPSSRKNYIGQTNLRDSNWHHILCMFIGFDNFVIYIDNKPEVMSYLSGTGTSVSFAAGYSSIGISGLEQYYSDAHISNVRVFGRLLKASEVNALYYEMPSNKLVLAIDKPIVDYISLVDNVDPFDDDSGVALYRFNDNVLDDGGNFNGTAYNVTYTDGKFGGSGVFNGSNAYVSSQVSLNTSFTFSIWLKPSSSRAGLTNSFCSLAYTNGNPYLNAVVHPTLGFYWNLVDSTGINDGGVYNQNFQPVYDDWNLFTVTVDRVTHAVRAYLGAVLMAEKTVNYTGNFVDVMYIGRDVRGNEGSYDYFLGNLDQLRIFNRALTQEEVRVLYNERVEL